MTAIPIDAPTPAPWVRRCAARLHARHGFALEEAEELAAEAYRLVDGRACPERTADELLGQALPSA
jgi:hypothetical protein